MKKHFQSAAKFLLIAAFFAWCAAVADNRTVSAQATIAGEWTAQAGRKDSEKIHVSFNSRTTKGTNNFGSDFSVSDFQNLSREQIERGGAVKFELAREAGTIVCEGKFESGKGAGTFRFTSNLKFVQAMKTRGFDFETSSKSADEKNQWEDRLFAAATLNVTTALADDLLSANFGKLDADDLFKAAIFKIDSKFMAEMKVSGFPNLTMEDLVKARIFKIDADFVRQIAQMGFDKEPFESLVKMRIFKITPEFISEIRGEGLTNLDVEDLTKLKIFNINSKFIRQARAEGVPLDVEKLVQKRIGVYEK